MGNDKTRPRDRLQLLNFNPRSLVGNDGIQQAINADTVAFQSTFPRGERRWKNLNVRCRRLFQSTFPRGERPDTRKMGMAHTNFNPRSLVGNDPPSAPATDTFVISIHVPSWGTTFFMPVEQLARHISIHVPSWGTTDMTCNFDTTYSISIHVPSWGTTNG